MPTIDKRLKFKSQQHALTDKIPSDMHVAHAIIWLIYCIVWAIGVSSFIAYMHVVFSTLEAHCYNHTEQA